MPIFNRYDKWVMHHAVAALATPPEWGNPVRRPEVQTTFSVEEVIAVEAGLAALKAEQAVLARWGGHSTELALHIDDLELLRDRLRQTRQRLTESFMSLPDYPEHV